MAQMIPETIPQKASQGEKLVFGVLRDCLPDDFMVWYEPSVKGFYPDFLILGPTFGLLILEVKGWYAGNIVQADHNYFQVKRKTVNGEQIKSERSPIKQAHDYFGIIKDKLVGYSILKRPDGNYQGNLIFPIGCAVVMSNITEAQARDEGLYVILERPTVTYRDEMMEWENLGTSALIQRLKDAFKVDFPFPPLTADQMSTIKGVLHPEMKIKDVPATEDSVPEGVPLLPGSLISLSLDLEQEKLARSLKDGHRVFSGVAGSGKTLILLARAKAIANRLESHRVLILCFNITLAAHLRSLLHGDEQNPQYRERIQVMHFHAWAKSLMRRLPNPKDLPPSEDYDEVLGEQMLAHLNRLSPEQKWDSVLVDEAHTFSPKWFLCCVAALRDPQDGDLLVVSDGNQSLYKRRKFSWASVGINARGRSRKLTQNYRNTQEILTAAWNVVSPLSTQSNSLDEVAFPVVEPSAALRHGIKPMLHPCRSAALAVEQLIQQVVSLCRSGFAPAEIAILYRYKSRQDDALFHGMLARLNQMGLATYWITENDEAKRNYSARKPGIRIITTLSSLGLEFKAVLLLWVEQFNDCCSRDLEKAALARRQLYVAMTRAQDELHVFGGDLAPVMRELSGGNGFEVMRLQESTHQR